MQTEDILVHKHLDSKLQFKSLNEKGEFEGYASTFHIDTDGERIAPGAFKRTLQHNNGIVPILFGHSVSEPCGWNLRAEEDKNGLKVYGRLTLETEIGKKAYYFIKGALEAGAKGGGLSIGFRVIKSHYEKIDADDPVSGLKAGSEVRVFDEVSLMEYSICVFQANIQSYVTAVKANFDQASAHNRPNVNPSDEKNQNDSESHRPESLKVNSTMPDTQAAQQPMIDQEIIAKAVKAALKAQAEEAAAAAKAAEDEIKAKAARQAEVVKLLSFTDALQGRQRERALHKQRSDIEGAMYDTLSAIHGSDMPVEKKKSAVADCYNDHAKAMTQWHNAYHFDGPNMDTTTTGAKSAKALSANEIRKSSLDTEWLQENFFTKGYVAPLSGVSDSAAEEGGDLAGEIEVAKSLTGKAKRQAVSDIIAKGHAKIQKTFDNHKDTMTQLFGKGPDVDNNPGADHSAPPKNQPVSAIIAGGHAKIQKAFDDHKRVMKDMFGGNAGGDMIAGDEGIGGPASDATASGDEMGAMSGNGADNTKNSGENSANNADTARPDTENAQNGGSDSASHSFDELFKQSKQRLEQMKNNG